MHRRRFLAAGTGITVAAGLSPAQAQRADPCVLHFVPQANLTALDPVWTTAAVSTTHDYTGLRDGLKWHDGTPVLARDCSASLQRWSRRDTFGQSLAQGVDSWGETDDRTLATRLKSP